MNRLEFCLRLAKGIFAGKQLANEQWQRAKPPQEFQQFISYWKPRTFVNGTLRGIDVDLKIDGGLRKFRFIEQNPNKTDNKGALKSFAQQARDGSQIVWLIDQETINFWEESKTEHGTQQKNAHIPSLIKIPSRWWLLTNSMRVTFPRFQTLSMYQNTCKTTQRWTWLLS